MFFFAGSRERARACSYSLSSNPKKTSKKKKDEVDEPFDITSAVLKGVLGRSGVRKQVDHKKKGKKQLQKRTLSDERT